MRRAKPRESGNKTDTARIFHGHRDFRRLRRVRQDAQTVPQPLHDGARHEDGTFQNVFRLARPRARAKRRQQAVAAFDEAVARVQQQKRARSVRDFHIAVLIAILSGQSRLLVARDARDRNRSMSERRMVACRGQAARRHDFRQHAARYPQALQQFVVPVQRADIEQHRAGGVRVVRHMRLAVAQLPDQIGIDRSEEQFAVFRAFPRIGDVVQQPFDFRAGEIRVDDQAGRLLNVWFKSFVLKDFADISRSTALPDDGAVDAFAGLLVPHQRRLPLVRDADGLDVLSGDADLRHRRHGGIHRAVDQIVGLMLHVAVLRIMLFVSLS